MLSVNQTSRCPVCCEWWALLKRWVVKAVTFSAFNLCECCVAPCNVSVTDKQTSHSWDSESSQETQPYVYTFFQWKGLFAVELFLFPMFHSLLFVSYIFPTVFLHCSCFHLPFASFNLSLSFLYHRPCGLMHLSLSYVVWLVGLYLNLGLFEGLLLIGFSQHLGLLF